MLFVPTIAGQMSGSIGAITFSRNAGGSYARVRVVPIDPGSPQQVTVRATMTLLTNRWVNVLTVAQRAAWTTYAANVPRPNRLGQLRFISGIAHYIRSNLPRVQADPSGFQLPIVDNGPTIFDVGGYTIPTLALVSPYADGSWSFNAADPWADETGSAMILYSARMQNPTINFFKGPYRSAGLIPGFTGTPPTSPANVTLAFPGALGTRTYARVNVTRADGRLGDPSRVLGTTI